MSLAVAAGTIAGAAVGFLVHRALAREWRALYEAASDELEDERERNAQLAREVNAANAEARASRRLDGRRSR